ncbi:MAG: hypothetical protein JSW66_07510 [Phycisphaerales bacterium]|nr:MAG: hypothetical protein JSW66_07510 [Phycisphaerales bacterium]
MTLQMFMFDKKLTPWGDYGSILVHGMAHRDDEEGLLQLERTGPYIPAITAPGIHDLLLTDQAKSAISEILPSLEFKPVVKAHIVLSNWHEWDRNADDPAEYPETGEPEDYVLLQPHDPNLAAQLGEVWELVPKIIPEIQGDNLVFKQSLYAGQHFVCPAVFGGCGYISADLKMALESTDPEWISFHEATVV